MSMDQVGLDQVSLDQMSLNQVRLDQVGVDQVSLDQVWLDQVGVARVTWRNSRTTGLMQASSGCRWAEQPMGMMAERVELAPRAAVNSAPSWPRCLSIRSRL